MTPPAEPRCPRCDWEGIELPDGGLMCADHGRYDQAGDDLRNVERGRVAAAWAEQNLPAAADALCSDCGGSGLRVDALRRAGESLTAEEVEMIDSMRCYGCGGDGWADGLSESPRARPPRTAG